MPDEKGELREINYRELLPWTELFRAFEIARDPRKLLLAAAAVVGYRVFQLGLPALFGAIALVRVQQVLAHPPPREEVAARYEAHRWR